MSIEQVDEEFEVEVRIGGSYVNKDYAPYIQATEAMALKLLREFLEDELVYLQPFLT